MILAKCLAAVRAGSRLVRGVRSQEQETGGGREGWFTLRTGVLTGLCGPKQEMSLLPLWAGLMDPQVEGNCDEDKRFPAGREEGAARGGGRSGASQLRSGALPPPAPVDACPPTPRPPTGPDHHISLALTPPLPQPGTELAISDLNDHLGHLASIQPAKPSWNDGRAMRQGRPKVSWEVCLSPPDFWESPCCSGSSGQPPTWPLSLPRVQSQTLSGKSGQGSPGSKDRDRSQFAIRLGSDLNSPKGLLDL